VSDSLETSVGEYRRPRAWPPAVLWLRATGTSSTARWRQPARQDGKRLNPCHPSTSPEVSPGALPIQHP